MDQITDEVDSDRFTLVVLSSGGAAGDGSSIVSESQAYGVLTAALALADLDMSDASYENAKTKFYGYFNGWRQMCINSAGQGDCQNPYYCNG